MWDMALTSASVGLSAVYVLYRVTGFMRKGAESNGCSGCAKDCGNCPLSKRN
jgi:hypothetical protein